MKNTKKFLGINGMDAVVIKLGSLLSKLQGIKLTGTLILFLIIGFGFTACGESGDDGGNGGGNWNGDYQTYGTTNYTKLDLNAKTITGVYKRGDGYSNWDGSAVISNVSVGGTSSFPSVSGTINHSGQWAYVFSDSKKIGVIYTWTMSTGSYTETDTKLFIGSTKKSDMSLWRPSDGTNPAEAVDLSDVEPIEDYYINATKEN